MPDTIEQYASARDVVRGFLAATSHEAWGERTSAELAERAEGLAAEATRIRAGAQQQAAAIRAGAEKALAAHPEWREEVEKAVRRDAGAPGRGGA